MRLGLKTLLKWPAAQHDYQWNGAPGRDLLCHRGWNLRIYAIKTCGCLFRTGRYLSLILLKNPSGQKATVKKTISDVSPDHSNRVQTKLARKNSRHFSYIFTHLQKRGVLQQNRLCESNFMRTFIPEPAELELIPDATEASEAAIADLNSASILETIRVRELTLTRVMNGILESSPSSHWGINE